MNAGERWRATYDFRPVDHLVRREFYIWGEAIERWKAEGLPPDYDERNLFNFDPWGQADVGLSLGWCEPPFRPAYEEKVVRTRATRRSSRTAPAGSCASSRAAATASCPTTSSTPSARGGLGGGRGPAPRPGRRRPATRASRTKCRTAEERRRTALRDGPPGHGGRLHVPARAHRPGGPALRLLRQPGPDPRHDAALAGAGRRRPRPHPAARRARRALPSARTSATTTACSSARTWCASSCCPTTSSWWATPARRQQRKLYFQVDTDG